MIEIDSKKEYDLNNMNVSAQNIQLGSFLKELKNDVSGSAVITTGCAVIGISPNTTTFDNNGFITFSGSARYWDDLFFPMLSQKQGATDKPPYDYNEIAVLFPPSDTSHIMYMIAQFPHAWALGTSINPHVHWKQTTGGSVVFKMEYKWFDIGGQVPATFNTFVMNQHKIPYTSGSMHQISAGSAMISGSHISGVSSILLVKLYRDDNTYTGNAVTYHFDIHYLRDSLGSHTEFNK